MSILELEDCFIEKRDEFEPFINSINFISFKNFETNAEILFNFPITVLVGKNGSNKSSALLALYGAVPDRMISDYWFSSAIDKELGDNPRYFYSYNPTDNQEEAQVRLTWQSNKRGDDYWETAKPAIQDGMNRFDKTIESEHKIATRWKKIDKDLVYINFKAQLSAFDKFFYHNSNPSMSTVLNASQQNYIRFHSKALNRAIKDQSKEQSHYGVNKIIKPYQLLTMKQIEDVSYILGRKYTKIGYIEHSFYKAEGGTAIISTDSMQYSEAFAGSGEFAIISMIVKLSSCPENSLILLDEPETSLHPGAQKKLLDYLVKVALKYKHQIVISTHSREMVESLPKEAIKVFTLTKDQGKINILNNVDASFAFTELGLETEKIVVYVEDRLVKEIVDRIVRADSNLKNRYIVKALGSASTIKQHYTPMFALSGQDNVMILLDGDQKTELYIENEGFEDPSDIPDKNVIDKIKSYYGAGIKTFASGGAKGVNVEEEIDNAKCIYRFIFNKVKYLPSKNGETYLLENSNIKDIVEKAIGSSLDLKEKHTMRKYAEYYCIKDEKEIKSDDVFEAEKNLIHLLFSNDPKYFDNLKEILF
ncbi:MAG TPA: ATP-binding protein [Candidatus Ignatzschineria merdigallinarum]|uniref:ATP-binding protein n=1 Tax=Candidatus Ignatzschineria merdigallinarum TaxID=2838621 RepID=A0A9D1TUN9_9GAMM|nr:ATP-binding protein [Candidatus Ignatzschineria merdigallinarum]